MGVSRGTTVFVLGAVIASMAVGKSVRPAPARTSTTAARAASVRSATVMYWGNHRIGTVDPGVFANPLILAISCPLYSGGGVEINRQRTWMVVFSAMNYNFGTARLLRAGKWSVYSAEHRALVGYAERRTPLRWDVVKGSRKVGHTVGPDGPQAAAALLLVCT
jgi:hypothetical protein